MRRRNEVGGTLALLALAQEVLRLPPNRRPPVTLLVIATQVLIFFTSEGRSRLVRKLAFCAELVLRDGFASEAAWARMLGSQWLHLSSVHLGYNMLSLLWKGTRLEPILGSVRFACMLACLACLTPVATTALSYVAADLFSFPDWLEERSVGFSGVLFALKTVLNARATSTEMSTMVLGLPFPARHAVWAELLFTYFFVPGTSFVGHFGGIVAGLIWLAGFERVAFGLLDAFFRRGQAQQPATYERGVQPTHGSTRFYGSGISGYRDRSTRDPRAQAHMDSDAEFARRLQEEELRRRS